MHTHVGLKSTYYNIRVSRARTRRDDRKASTGRPEKSTPKRKKRDLSLLSPQSPFQSPEAFRGGRQTRPATKSTNPPAGVASNDTIATAQGQCNRTRPKTARWLAVAIHHKKAKHRKGERARDAQPFWGGGSKVHQRETTVMGPARSKRKRPKT